MLKGDSRQPERVLHDNSTGNRQENAPLAKGHPLPKPPALGNGIVHISVGRRPGPLHLHQRKPPQGWKREAGRQRRARLKRRSRPTKRRPPELQPKTECTRSDDYSRDREQAHAPITEHQQDQIELLEPEAEQRHGRHQRQRHPNRGQRPEIGSTAQDPPHAHQRSLDEFRKCCWGPHARDRATGPQFSPPSVS